jgi:nucleotide-binding universal stress UspA family protein
MKLLIPVDGSERSLLAIDHALALADQGLQIDLVLVNVQEPASLYELVTLHDAEALAKVAHDAGMDMLAPAIARASAAGVPFIAQVLTGDPAAMVLEVLEQQACSGIVLSSRGHGVLRGGWLGSVSQALIEDAPVPVTVVKPADTAAD